MARQRRNFGRVDRDFIRKLPDCVLHHIVSLLPYKEAARTATLSTRWRRVLPSERVVDLDERKLGFLFRGESGFASVTKVLMENYREACMDKFSLTLNVSHQESSEREKELSLYQSGSAPLKVEGSLSAMRVLFDAASPLWSFKKSSGEGFATARSCALIRSGRRPVGGYRFRRHRE